MQFNRNEYLDGNFDHSSVKERENAYYAEQYKGLEWNNYIAPYFKFYLGNTIGSFGYSYSIMKSFADVGTFIDMGLFAQAAEALSNVDTGNETINANLAKWVEYLKKADDYTYQLENNTGYVSTAVQDLINAGVYNDYADQLKNTVSEASTPAEEISEDSDKEE